MRQKIWKQFFWFFFTFSAFQLALDTTFYIYLINSLPTCFCNQTKSQNWSNQNWCLISHIFLYKYYKFFITKKLFWSYTRICKIFAHNPAGWQKQLISFIFRIPKYIFYTFQPMKIYLWSNNWIGILHKSHKIM